MSKGYIKLFRQIQDCWIWDTGRFDKRSAWIDLLMLANHGDKKIVFNGQYITIRIGQYLTSIRKLSDRWGWSVSTVSTFLSLLEEDLMIKKESDNHRTLITIINYEVFQGVPNTKDTPIDTQTDTHIDTQTETNNTLNTLDTLNIKEKEIPKGISKKKNFTPPTTEEVENYCQENNYNIDAQRFVDFYESKGWMVGKNKMKDWKAAVRNWVRRQKEEHRSEKPLDEQTRKRYAKYDRWEKEGLGKVDENTLHRREKYKELEKYYLGEEKK